MKQFLFFIFVIAISAFIGTTALAQQDCDNSHEILTLPFAGTELSTSVTGNNYSADDACSSASMANNDYVFSFTASEDMQINVILSNTAIVTGSLLPFANIGLFVIEGCPNDLDAVCVASIGNIQANPSLNDVDLTSGITYYIIVSSANTLLGDATSVNFDINITKNNNHDIKITEIIAASSSCSLGESTIACYITNLGLVSETGFDVSYSINGGTLVTQEFTQVIEPGDTLYFEFTQVAEFPTIGEYEILVNVNLINDEDNTNDELTITRVRLPLFDTFPFVEDFESGNGYWFAGGTASSWAYGTPDDTNPELIINSAASGNNIWVTNLTGVATMNEISYIESPCFDLSSLFLPTLSVKYWADFAIFGNSASIVASTDDGMTWDITIATITATTTGWQALTVGMPDLSGFESVKFRINFTGGFLNGDGLAIDDFEIKEAVLNDVGIIAMLKPNSGCGLSATETITIEVYNFGAQTQTNVEVNYSIDGGNSWLANPEVIDGEIEAGATILYTFTNTVNLTTIGEYNIVAKTVHPGDEDNTNDEVEKTVVSQNTIAADGYEESFEDGAAGWFTYGQNSSMELATPAAIIITGAGDGTMAWVTNATGAANANEISYLESPCFDFSDMVNPVFKVMINYNTTMFMSDFCLEYTLDGEIWDTVQAGPVSENWYGTGLIAFGTWGGDSQGWLNAKTSMPQFAGESSVKFRFSYNAGAFAMGSTEGVAIDNVVIYDCDVFPSASFTYTADGMNIEFQNESENADSYLWNFGDNQFLPSTSTEENPVFSYMMDGTYYVLLTVTNECSSDEYGVYIDIMTSSEIVINNQISIYPNPAEEFINVSAIENSIVTITNISGQQLFTSTTASNSHKIDIKDLAAGTYFIKIQSNDEISVIPFVKK